MSEYPWNEKNNTFTWLSSLYNSFNPIQDGLFRGSSWMEGGGFLAPLPKIRQSAKQMLQRWNLAQLYLT